jgi:hypothetical protein
MSPLVFTRKCSPVICPPCDLGTVDWTGEQVVLRNLDRPGPTNGSCKDGNAKWIFNGPRNNRTENRCCCLTVIDQPIGNELCSECILGTKEMIRSERIRLNLDQAGPDSGYCPKDKNKFVYEGALIGRDKNKCCCLPESLPPLTTTPQPTTLKCSSSEEQH